MKRCTVFFMLCLSLLFLFGSCRSTETITEYVPVKIDLGGVIEPVFKLRPDNRQLDIHENVKTTFDIVYNSLQYQTAWENWQIYAETLEKVLADIQEVYGQDTTEEAISP